MEASAFIQLCDHFGPNGPTCLGVVKGISDFGNSKKGHDATARDDALKNTAKALEDWITYHITKITWTPDESTLMIKLAHDIIVVELMTRLVAHAANKSPSPRW